MRIHEVIGSELKNIREVNLEPGEWWELIDSFNGKATSTIVEILKVTKDTTNQYNKLVNVKVLKADQTGALENGTEVSFQLSSLGSPIKGRRLKQADEEVGDITRKVDDLVLTKAIALETVTILSTAKDRKYTLEFDSIIQYLQKIGLLDKASGSTITSQKKFVRNCCKSHAANVVKFHGRYVKLTNLDVFSSSAAAIVATPDDTKRVNLDKLVHGITLILESGIFGKVKIE